MRVYLIQLDVGLEDVETVNSFGLLTSVLRQIVPLSSYLQTVPRASNGVVNLSIYTKF